MKMQEIIKFIRNHSLFLVLLAFSLLIFVVSVRVTMFRYRNFEFGKFDLGNMSQMVYNTSRGNFMEVTDYFGTNMPRWGMSHVDPFLVVFAPIYWIFPDARVLVIGQLFLVVSSAIILYFIGLRVTSSKVISFFISMAFLFYPANGFLLAWTGFHGVTAVIPFFLLAFLMYEIMDEKGFVDKKNLLLFSLFTFLTLSGKEEISLIILFYGLYILALRKLKVVGVGLIIIGLLWFGLSFLILIPSAAKYRVEGFNEFAKSIDLKDGPSKDVTNENYFLARYDEFGSTYGEILLNMIIHPDKVVEIFFSGDKKDNFVMTFLPLLFTPFLFLPVLFISIPEFAINYLTTQGGIGTAEIYNHRISMIIPIMFVSIFFGLKLVEDFFRLFTKLKGRRVTAMLSVFVLVACLYTSNQYQNPVVLWFTQSVQKRLALEIFAYAHGDEQDDHEGPALGQKVKINRLETKDFTCFNEALTFVNPEDSVTSPDYLGAHLSTRRVNALFPANFESADVVIVDVFSKKVQTILGLNESLVNQVVGKVLTNRNYKLVYSCSNIFVFRKTAQPRGDSILPMQDSFVYKEKYLYNIGSSAFVVEANIPETIQRGEPFDLALTYKKEGSSSLDSYILYTTFRNIETGQLHQLANLPSFGLMPMNKWEEGRYYIETNTFVLPKKLPKGDYEVFVGTTNMIKTSNTFIGVVNVD